MRQILLTLSDDTERLFDTVLALIRGDAEGNVKTRIREEEEIKIQLGYKRPLWPYGSCPEELYKGEPTDKANLIIRKWEAEHDEKYSELCKRARAESRERIREAIQELREKRDVRRVSQVDALNRVLRIGCQAYMDDSADRKNKEAWEAKKKTASTAPPKKVDRARKK